MPVILVDKHTAEQESMNERAEGNRDERAERNRDDAQGVACSHQPNEPLDRNDTYDTTHEQSLLVKVSRGSAGRRSRYGLPERSSDRGLPYVSLSS